MSTQKNTQDMSVKISALEQRLSALEAREEAHFAEHSQSIAELNAKPQPEPPKSKGRAKKTKEPKPEGAEAEPKKTNDWTAFVSQTVAEMKESGWEAFQSADGIEWPASRREGEQYVYDGGEHDGKAPSHSKGGMVRASYLRNQNNPEAEAKSKAYRAGLAEKRSTGSVASAQPEGEPTSKKGRPKMTEEQKAAAKVKRDAKKAAAQAVESKEEEEMAAEEAGFQSVDEGSTTPKGPPPQPQQSKASVGGASTPAKTSVGGSGKTTIAGGSLSKISSAITSKKAAEKTPDLSLFGWTFKGVEYYKNDRGDVLTYDFTWVGRFNGVSIDKTVQNPLDMADPIMREDD